MCMSLSGIFVFHCLFYKLRTNDNITIKLYPGGIAKPIEKVYSAQFPTAGGYRLELTVPKKLLHTAEKILASIPSIPGVTVQAQLK